MIQSVKIARRQSEIRQSLAELAGKESPSEDEARSMETLDGEYRANETRYRASLVAEDTERRDAGSELESRDGRAWGDLVAGFELRQVALALDEGRQLDGATAEVVSELRALGGFRGIPVPYQALETRAGETTASGVPDPIRTAPIIDRLFETSVASMMGVQVINIPFGLLEYPVVTSAITAQWTTTELGLVPVERYMTADRTLRPDHNLGVQVRISRRALKQSGEGLEQAIRRDLAGTIRQQLDRAVFLGSGAAGEPLGIIPGATAYGITSTAVDGPMTWAALRAAIVRFMQTNAANGPGGVRLLLRPEVWNEADNLLTGLSISEWDRVEENVGAIVMSTNALAAPTGAPLASAGILTTVAEGVAPAYVGLWGALDMIRDPYTDAQSGGLRITALATADVTVARGSQIEILTGLQ